MWPVCCRISDITNFGSGSWLGVTQLGRNLFELILCIWVTRGWRKEARFNLLLSLRVLSDHDSPPKLIFYPL